MPIAPGPHELNIPDLISLTRIVDNPTFPGEKSWDEMSQKLTEIVPVAETISLQAIAHYRKHPLDAKEIIILTQDEPSPDQIPARFTHPPDDAVYAIKELLTNIGSLSETRDILIRTLPHSQEPSDIEEEEQNAGLQLSTDDIDTLLAINLTDENRAVLPPLLKIIWNVKQSDTDTPSDDLVTRVWREANDRIIRHILEKYRLTQEAIAKRKREEEIRRIAEESKSLPLEEDAVEKKSRSAEEIDTILSRRYAFVFSDSESPDYGRDMYERRRSVAECKAMCDFVSRWGSLTSMDGRTAAAIAGIMRDHVTDTFRYYPFLRDHEPLTGKAGLQDITESLFMLLTQPDYIDTEEAGKLIQKLDQFLYLELNDISENFTEGSLFYRDLSFLQSDINNKVETRDPVPQNLTHIEHVMQRLFARPTADEYDLQEAQGGSRETIMSLDEEEIAREIDAIDFSEEYREQKRRKQEIDENEQATLRFMEEFISSISESFNRRVGILRLEHGYTANGPTAAYKEEIRQLYYTAYLTFLHSEDERKRFSIIAVPPDPEELELSLIPKLRAGLTGEEEDTVSAQAAKLAARFFSPVQRINAIARKNRSRSPHT